MGSGLKFMPYAVAYLDILGFKNFVKEAEVDVTKRDKLDLLFNKIIPRQISIAQNNKSFPSELGMKCLSVSDSIVISVPVHHRYPQNYPALIAVSIKSIQITHALLEMGLLVRGAIAIGNVYRSDNNILGSGYQEAVDGENKAVHPQIVLTASAARNLSEEITARGERPSFFAKNDQEQKIILNAIYPQHPSYWRNTSREEWDHAKHNEEAVERFRIYRQVICENLSIDDERARDKWTWFASLFNSNVNYFSQLRSNGLEITLGVPGVGFTMNFLNTPIENSDWTKDFAAPGIKVII
ncbi:hypothetical protein HHS34_007265 [Acidithiobacillus montserratensis]|uniref:Uncharacterized protein n=1 Tax=Acidithiobacillus montserratensis TaxID=2729135 RepID=A0ACD5HBQ1_9PROT|nr:hypothetical protein [Acidithiobacillus montserratensis]MBU2748254.1 hypothetical protein [Acidithiobacillus montserratensis]